MAVQAQAKPGPAVVRQSSWVTVRQVLMPLVQIFAFIVGCAVTLGGIVILLALVLPGDRLNLVLTLLPFVIIDALVLGFLYATIALGYTLVYGVLEFINFAHGEIFMVGAFAGGELVLFLAARGLLKSMPPLLIVVVMVLVGMAVSGLLAMAIERTAYRPLRNAPRLVPLISAIGVSLVLQDVVRFIEGTRGRFHLTFPDLGLPPPYILGQTQLATGAKLNVMIDSKSLIFMATALVILTGLNYMVNATRLGKAIRAVAQDRPTASLMGINVNRIIAITFLIGGAMGGAAGVLFGLKVGTINPYIGFLPGLKAFTAAVLGGIGNITGAMVGGIVLGFLESFVSGYLSLFTGGRFGGADYASVAAFLILIGILIFRPSGLLGEATTQKV